MKRYAGFPSPTPTVWASFSWQATKWRLLPCMSEHKTWQTPTHLQKLIHKYDIPMRKETVLCLDAHNRPLGNASCGPGPMKKYELQAAPVAFGFI